MDEDHKGIRQVADALRALLEVLRAEYPISSIVVFGSRGRGDFLADSDVDVGVISPAFADLPAPERIDRILKNWEGRLALEAVGLTPDELAACKSALCWEILEDGVAIFDDGTFRKARVRFQKIKERQGLRRTNYGWSMGKPAG